MGHCEILARFLQIAVVKCRTKFEIGLGVDRDVVDAEREQAGQAFRTTTHSV
jgi:hypothetical protein